MDYNFKDYELDLFFRVPVSFEEKHDMHFVFIRPDKVVGYNIMYWFKADEKEYYKIRFYLEDGNSIDSELMPSVAVKAYLRDFENKLEFVTKRC